MAQSHPQPQPTSPPNFLSPSTNRPRTLQPHASKAPPQRPNANFRGNRRNQQFQPNFRNRPLTSPSARPVRAQLPQRPFPPIVQPQQNTFSPLFFNPHAPTQWSTIGPGQISQENGGLPAPVRSGPQSQSGSTGPMTDSQPFFPPPPLPPPSMPFQFLPHPPMQAISDGIGPRQLTPEELEKKPRPHPHLPSSILHLSHVPADLPEKVIAEALRDCMPVRIRLNVEVPNNVRIQPDAYYDWMPKSGTLEFDDMYNVEKAMAILVSHPVFTARVIMVSPYPPPSALPIAESRGRYITPLHRMIPAYHHIQDVNAFVYCPSPAEVFEAIRGWGTIRSISIWSTHASPEQQPVQSVPPWGARVEFWYEDEANRFEIGFTQRGGHVKGWTISIVPEPSFLSMPTLPYQQPLQSPLPLGPAPAGAPTTNDLSSLDPTSLASTVITSQGLPQITHPLTGAPLNHPQFSYQLPPATPPPIDLCPPWASHNAHTIKGIETPLIAPGPIQIPFPLTPPTASFGLPLTPATSHANVDAHQRRMSKCSQTSLSSLRSSRDRTWSVTLDQGPDGEMRPVGFVADDGMVIQHGPGQHIRPAPLYGPGSNSSSGLVDYNNVFVKNLDPDINSEFLSEIFSSVGRIVSARVMRDNTGKSRGYGFVSFQTPLEAALAIQALNGQKIGYQYICVTLHEPRKLRPEKLMERRRMGSPTAYGRMRRSSSPHLDDAVRGRKNSDEMKPAATTDHIRSLSPVSRKEALVQRIAPVVHRYAKVHKVPEAYCEPAIQALANQDLAIIPILYHHANFTAKVAEAIAALQEDPKVVIVADTAQPESIERPTRGEIEQIKLGIQMIDPVDVDRVLPILLENLDSTDIEKCINDRSELASRYNTAKKQLVASCESTERSDPVSEPENVPLPPSDMEVPTPERLDLGTATLGDLLSLSCRDILSNVQGPGGDALLTKLGLSRPTISDQRLIDAFCQKALSMDTMRRKVEITNLLAKRITGKPKKSVKLKLAREIVNAETDEEALCQIMAYSDLLNAKYGPFFRTMDTPQA